MCQIEHDVVFVLFSERIPKNNCFDGKSTGSTLISVLPSKVAIDRFERY